MKSRLGFPLLVLIAGLLVLCACNSAAEEERFRSEQFHLETTLPPGWAAAEGPRSLARPFTGWVAFNSWGEDDFWAPEVVTETEQGIHASYGPEDVLGQLPPDGAYIVLSHLSGGPVQPAEQYGPEYRQERLANLWNQTDCREGGSHPGATVVPFYKWGRYLRLEVYCAPESSDATAEEVNALLESWRFDQVPAGDVAWASLEARKQLPASVQPERFPLLTSGPGTSTSQRQDMVWTTSAGYLETAATPGTQIPGATVVVTFTARWDAPLGGPLPEECPPDQCHWWRFEARPDGKIALMAKGGGEDWDGASLIPTPRQWFPPAATPGATGSPVTGQGEAFAASRAALADYEPAQDADAVVEALSEDCAEWLTAGQEPAGLADAPRALPKLTRAEVEVDTVDLNGDDVSDVVIEPQFFGLRILVWRECEVAEEGYTDWRQAEACFGRPAPIWSAEDERKSGTRTERGLRLTVGDDRLEVRDHDLNVLRWSTLTRNGWPVRVLLGGALVYPPNISLRDITGKVAWEFAGEMQKTIIYNGRDIRRLYDLDAAYRPYEIDSKLIFVGQNDGARFVVYDGERIGPEFDEIIVAYCCEPAAYSVRFGGGRYAFWGTRGDRHYLVELSAG